MDLLGGYGSDDASSSDESDSSSSSSPAASSIRDNSRGATKRHGKKLVSLHAVLPTHILDQLTKGGMDDSDDEEVAPSRPAAQDTKRHAVVAGKDEGLSSFLSELKSAPTTTFLGGGSTPNKKPSSEPLGQAFTTTKVVVSKTQTEAVMDVHAKQVAVGSEKQEVAAPVAAKPPRPTVSVPRPGVRCPVVSAPTTTVDDNVPRQQVPVVSNYQPQEEPKKVDARIAKKRSRKEMEKALRAGNLDAVEDAGMTTLEAEAQTYTPQEETYRVPSSGIVKSASVKMYDPKAGTDVLQGEVSSKHRGKHQINQLLASAASLELQRARAIGTSGGKGKRADAKSKYGW